MTQNRNKIATSFRLSPEAMGMLDRLKERTGLSQAGILELAIRRMAEAEGVREGAGVTKVTEETQNGSD